MHEFLKHAVSRVKAYQKDCGRPARDAEIRPVQIGWLQSTISKFAGIDIRPHEVCRIPEHDFTDRREIKAKLCRTGKGYARIYYLAEGVITRGEQRFVLVKEKSHLLIDTPGSFTKSPSRLGRGLINGHDFTQGDGNASLSESVAAICAMELLFPWREREPNMRKLRLGETSAPEIAGYYGVPEERIVWILGADNHARLKRIHDDID